MSTTHTLSRSHKIRTVSAIFAALALMLFSVPDVQAKPGDAGGGGFTGPKTAVQQGGFTGPGPDMTTVQATKSMADDAWVTLKGNIIKHNGKNRYTFRDATGEIEVKIDREAWNGQDVSPSDVVEIRGEVDKDWNEMHLDVKRIIKTQ